jgi:hypothetical protein
MNFVQFDEQKVLDKIARVWYNGKFGRLAERDARSPAAKIKKE